MLVDANRRNVVGFLVGEVERDKNYSEYVSFRPFIIITLKCHIRIHQFTIGIT